MQLSYWERESFFTDIDVAIIGSGIVGLSAALHLKQKAPKLNIIVLERGILPYGASTRNAGFACFGSPSELIDDLQKTDKQDVFNLVERRWKGLQRLRQNLGDSTIQYEGLGSYEVFKESDNDIHQQCLDNLHLLNEELSSIIGTKEVYKIADKKIPVFGVRQVNHLIENTAEGQIDTGKMMKALINKVSSLGVPILTGINVSKIEETTTGVDIVIADTFSIKTRKTIVATNAFVRQLLPELDITPGRAQVLITKPIMNLKLKGCFHYDRGYYYFRNVGNRVLLGGGRNLDFKAEETTAFGLTELVQNKLDDLLQNIILPDIPYEVDMRWSGIMGLGGVKNTIVKAISPNTYCAVRCGGMGVAVGSLAGEEVADLVSEGL